MKNMSAKKYSGINFACLVPREHILNVLQIICTGKENESMMLTPFNTSWLDQSNKVAEQT